MNPAEDSAELPRGAALTGSDSLDATMIEIMESFIVEANEIIEQLGKDLLALEEHPEDTELLNSVFRGVHTLKGTSSFLGFEQLAQLEHELETILNRMRKGEMVVSPELMDLIFSAQDAAATLLSRIEERRTDPLEIDDLLERLRVAAGTGQSVHAPAKREIPGEKADRVSTEADQSRSRLADSTLRVDVRRLDDLMNLVGELVLGRNRLTQVSAQLSEQNEHNVLARDLGETSSQIDFVTTELQMAVMRARMLPVSRLFNRLPRLVRDLAKETGKSVELERMGEETELDKSIIDSLNDPLVHLLRNAVDHGIETAAERIASGKSPTGKLSVGARHQGNHIILTIADDGAGIDTHRVAEKAIERGLLPQSQVAGMSQAELLDLIFLPGLSTAKSVTSVSGRGVGMDVVRSNIAKLKGTIDIQSQRGKGSTFTIRLPLTLAIIQGLLVAVRSEVFAIPVPSVLEVVRVKPEELASVDFHPVIRLREAILPVVSMQDVIGLEMSKSEQRSQYAVVVAWGENRAGILVDALLGQREIVIKSLGDQFGSIPGIAGSTILGDGRTILIVDTEHLLAARASKPESVEA